MKLFAPLLLLFTCSLPFAQISFDTGNAQLDADLNEINMTAKADLNLFKSELKTEFSVSDATIDQMFSMKMEPAEAYFSLEISSIVKQDVDKVLATYKAHKDKGWGYIAKQMGIKPGSEEFHALKDRTKGKKGKSKGNSGKGHGKGGKKK